MAEQLYDTGDVIQAGVNALEVVGVSYQHADDGEEKIKFSYTVRLQSELDAEREAEAERLKAIEDAEAEAKAAETEKAAA